MAMTAQMRLRRSRLVQALFLESAACLANMQGRDVGISDIDIAQKLRAAAESAGD
jgi:hypothetical protein